MLRFLDAGESHGKGLVAIIEGFPSNVEINMDNVNRELLRRQSGYGRGERMKIEKDKVELMAGVRGGKTTGGPISIIIINRDYENWQEIMDIEKEYHDKIVVPRPGHADLNGALKYNHEDIRNVIERASARETAIRVAVGAICMELLRCFNVKIVSRVLSIGNIRDESVFREYNLSDVNLIENSPVRCISKESETKMIEVIEAAKQQGETLGGQVESTVFNLPPGLGSHVIYDRRMDYRIAGAVMSIQGVKAVEIGEGVEASMSLGTSVNDSISMVDKTYVRATNYAGGIEGGMTNGMPLVVKASMKPIPTTRKGIKTVALSGEETISRYERSDVCVVPALGVICESVLAYEIANSFLEKFGGDSIEDVVASYNFYMERIREGRLHGGH